jgi:hypothetical protein
MSNQTRATADVSLNESCRGNCEGYGSRSFCPPLIILAMHSERSESERMLERARYPHNPGLAQETGLFGHFSGHLASPGFCNCMFTHFTQLSNTRSEM